MTRKEALTILELAANATPEDIQRAYRELVRVWHPDRFPNDATLRSRAQEKLKRINEAHDTLESGAFATGQAASDDSEPLPYCDLEVRYLGSDPRLKPINSKLIGAQQGTAARVGVTEQDIQLLTASGNQLDEGMHYPISTLICLRERQFKWVFPNTSGAYESGLATLPNTDLVFLFSDPAHVVRNGITLRLRFRNDYYARLFVKRVCSAFSLVAPEPPKHKPQPTPPPAAEPQPTVSPVSEPSSATSAKSGDKSKPFSTLSVLVVLMLFLSVVVAINYASRPNSNQKSEQGETIATHDPDNEDGDSIEQTGGEAPKHVSVPSTNSPPPSIPNEIVQSQIGSNSSSRTTAPSPGTRGDNSPLPASVANSPDTFTSSIGLKLKRIKVGTFSKNSIPKVQVTKDYYIAIYEVTQREYQAVMGDNPSHFKGGDLPVESVSRDDAIAFCGKLNARDRARLDDWHYRLPTETEWEFAARAGSYGIWSHGDSDRELGEFAWYGGNSAKATHVVGSKKPNAWGLYDMSGNVSEWCSDWYDVRSLGSGGVRRGGSWGSLVSSDTMTLSHRTPCHTWKTADFLGFRLALVKSRD